MRIWTFGGPSLTTTENATSYFVCLSYRPSELQLNFIPVGMAEVHGLFTPGPDLMALAQEKVMERDNDGLLVALIRLKEVV